MLSVSNWRDNRQELAPKLASGQALRYAVAHVDDPYGKAVGEGAVARVRESGHFPLPAGIAHQQQIHDVCAGNQQHQSYGAGKHQQDALQFRSGRVFHRFDEHPKKLVRIRILNGFLLIQSDHLVASLRQRDAGFKPCDADESVMNVLGQVVSVLADGHPNVRPTQKMKICRQHARYRITLVVERDRSTYHPWIASKPALPKVVAQNHHRRTACPILFRNEIVARRELYPKHGEQSRACVTPEHALRFSFAG